MFHNTETEDREMVRAVSEAIAEELLKQTQHTEPKPLSIDRLAIAAIWALARWARAHPPPQWFNDNHRKH